MKLLTLNALYRSGAVLSCALLLSGCLSSNSDSDDRSTVTTTSSGSGSTPPTDPETPEGPETETPDETPTDTAAGPTFADYDALYASRTTSTMENGATTDLPTSGSASYAGQFQTTVIDASTANQVGTIRGDVNLDVTFASPTNGFATSPVTGTATVTDGLDMNGNPMAASGTFSTQDTIFPSTLNTYTGAFINQANPGSTQVDPNSTQGGLAVNMGGTLATDAVSGNVQATMAGPMTGPGASGSTGGFGLVGTEIAGEGTYVLDRQ